MIMRPPLLLLVMKTFGAVVAGVFLEGKNCGLGESFKEIKSLPQSFHSWNNLSSLVCAWTSKELAHQIWEATDGVQKPGKLVTSLRRRLSCWHGAFGQERRSIAHYCQEARNDELLYN